jgi:hypothetical protein
LTLTPCEPLPLELDESASGEEDAVDFHGNVPYCYSNGVAMLLSAHGERVYPGLVEVLTGIGLGAVRTPDGRTWFSSTQQDVPAGVDKALELLGCTFTTEDGPEDAAVEALLRTDLATGPVMLGPLDMGWLTYIPWHRELAGADHYLVAYRVDGQGVHVQDPAGFPCARLGLDDLAQAWRAERIAYGGGAFHRWLGVRRVGSPAGKELHDAALAWFASRYRDRPSGGAVIRELADRLQPGRVDPGDAGFLTAFSFPLGARRALDYAGFFEQGGDAALAASKHAQARLFGRCQEAANRGDWPGVADALGELARHEDDLEHAFTG